MAGIWRYDELLCGGGEVKRRRALRAGCSKLPSDNSSDKPLWLLLGVEFIEDGVRLRPGLPLESYSFESPLHGVSKSKTGYEGWYAPAAAGEWTVHVTLPESAAGQRMYAEINGKRSRVAVQAGGVIQLRGSSGPGKPLRWALRR